MDVSAFEKLQDFNRNFGILEKLWGTQKIWEEKYMEWGPMHIFKMEVYEMNELLVNKL